VRFWKEHEMHKNLPMNKKYKHKYLVKYRNGEIEKLTLEHELGFPNFKKKGVNDSFYLEYNAQQVIQIEGKKIKIPTIGWIKTYEILPTNIVGKSVTISRQADDWFISFLVEEVHFKNESTAETGIDLGIKTLATFANEKKWENPKAYKKQKAKLRRMQIKLSRQREFAKKNGIKTGTNYEKTKKKIAKLHQRIGNVRNDNTHKLTYYSVKNHKRAVIEDLGVSGMVKNHNLASAILDGGFYEFRRQMEYKCKWHNVDLVIADRWFASTKTCSRCGHKKDKMPLKERTFHCEKCKLTIDRDLNAAINLMKYAHSEGVKDCGDAKFHAECRQVSVSEAVIEQQSDTV
jgi:putative transposase